MAIRVLVVDDNDFVRRSVVSVLDQVDGIDVVAECADGIEVAVVAERLRPDVVVMDVQMPIMTGIDAARLLRTSLPESRVLFLSALITPRAVAAAAAAGAVGFLQKDGNATGLIRAVIGVASGETAWPDAMTPVALDRVGH